MVEHKDVVLAVLGASAGLSGLVLVFLGLVAAAAASYAPGTKKAIIARARRPAYSVLAAFGLGVACTGAATAWLLTLKDPEWLYVTVVLLFVAQLTALAVAATWTSWATLWD